MIPFPLPGIKTLAALIVAGSVAGFGWWSYNAGKRSEQAAQNAQTVETLKLARQRDEALRISKEKALEDQKKSLIQNIAAAERVRDRERGLLNTSQQSLAASRKSHAACIVSAATHAELFGECRSEYGSLGQKAQGHATDIKALTEAWPK